MRYEIDFPHDLWSSLDKLMGRGYLSSDGPSAQDLHDFFVNKFKEVREATETSPIPMLPVSFPHHSLCDF